MHANQQHTIISVFVQLSHLYYKIQVFLLLTQFCLKHAKKVVTLSKLAKERRPKKRIKWHEFKQSLSDSNFRRMFRMSKECFDDLCSKIIDTKGQSEFKSEMYIETNLKQKHNQNTSYKKRKRSSVYHANTFTSGEYICGEVKLAITLRILAGGSYLDLGALYSISYNYTYEIFHYVIKEWINNDHILPYPGLDYFDDIVQMMETARDFESCGNHHGIFSGIIGAIDGWLVKIRCPRKSDRVGNSVDFYSRKGFYSVNVQAMVNKHKLILWRSIKSCGTEHDSNAFKKTSMYNKLLDKFNELASQGLYIIGDSAYALRSFLLVPYDNAQPYSAEDTFNYHHSTCRIWVECAFGEIDMRWGILWKPLNFSFEHNMQVIDATMRLHNFIVMDRMKNNNIDNHSYNNEFNGYHEETIEFLRSNPHEVVGVLNANDHHLFSDNDGRGRLQRSAEQSKQIGRNLRDHLKDNLVNGGYTRPLISTGAKWYRDRCNRTRYSSN